MNTGDRVYWVHVEQASPDVVRYTICEGRLISGGRGGVSAVWVAGSSMWFVDSAKLVASRADAEYCLRLMQTPTPQPEPELCCIVVENPVPTRGGWTRSISQCEHDRKMTTVEGWECRDCGYMEVFS